jgi:hypothetical protein
MFEQRYTRDEGIPEPSMRLTFVLFALLLQQRCNMASPEAIKGKVEDALRPYFPNARGMVNPQTQAIIGFTCTQGMGQQFIEKMQTYIATDRQIHQQLGMVQFAPLLGGAHYRYFLLVFDGGSVRYDIETQQVATLTIAPQVLQIYRQTCGFD